MSPLEELAVPEMSVLAGAHCVTGLMDAKDRALREAGVYRESAAIHRAYTELAASSGAGLEPLKRAVFLGWYAAAEPACFTGVADLHVDSVACSLDILDGRWQAGDIDTESAAILGWYWLTADGHFRMSGASDEPCGALATLEPLTWQELGFTVDGPTGRGSMGHYWISVLTSGWR